MSKTSKRAILTYVIIATFLISMIPIIPVMAAKPEVDVVETGAYSTWTVETAAAGIYSLHVTLPLDVSVNGLDVIATLDPNMTLAEVTELTFWENVVDPGGDPDYPVPPLGDIEIATGITLYLDMNDDGVFDWVNDAQIVLECPKNDPLVLTNLNTWDERDAFTDGYTGFDKGGGQLGLPSGDITYWKTTAYSTYTVLQVGLVLGWGNYGDYEGYLDDITVNAVTYPLESDLPPPPGGGFSIDYVTLGDAYYGKTLTVMGSGVTSGSTVNFYWDFVTASALLNSTTGKPSGDFECTVKVPSAYYGNHYLWVKDLASGISVRSQAIFVVPKIKLSPSSGLKGDNVIVKGYGFSVKSDIAITFTGGLATAGTDKTDDLGYFEYTFKVGDVLYDPYTVTAADTHTASATFKVGAAITLDKTVGPAGTIVKVDGRGYSSKTVINTEVDIKLDGVSVSTKDGKNVTASDAGVFTVYIVIPSVEIGEYEITIDDEVRDASADFEVDGETSIKVTPSYGTPGTVLQVKGYNFTRVSGTDVELKLKDQTAEATTDASGSFTATIIIPPLDFGETYPVTANDTRLCHAEDDVLVALMVLQLSKYSAPVGSKIMLMGSGLTQNGDWNATFGDLDLIEDSTTSEGTTYFSKDFWIPSVPSGTYTIGVYDVDRKITVNIDFTVTDQAALSVNRASIPNGYNLTIEGVNFVELVGQDTEWWIYNSTDAWLIDDNVTQGPADVITPVPVTDKNGEILCWYEIPAFLDLGSYTINCTTVSNDATDPKITQYAEVDIEIVPEEILINIGAPSYARGQTITFVIKATLKKDPFYLGIKDPEGSEVFNSTWDTTPTKTYWATLGAWYYIPSNKQIDISTGDVYSLPADAMAGTWTYSIWDADKEYANGTFQVTELTEIQQLQQDIGEIVSGITGIGASNTELAEAVEGVSGAAAEAVAAAAAAAAAAAEAQTAAESAIAAVEDVGDIATDALDAANDAKTSADLAKIAADSGLQAANDAKALAQQSADAADKAAEAAEANSRQTSGLTTLVYGAIGASLIAALAAIVSLMQISRRIAG